LRDDERFVMNWQDFEDPSNTIVTMEYEGGTFGGVIHLEIDLNKSPKVVELVEDEGWEGVVLKLNLSLRLKN
jgi:methylase of polypeptide subunit release factors